MEMNSLQTLFDIHALTAVITGGSCQLAKAIALGLAQAGVKVAIKNLHAAKAAVSNFTQWLAVYMAQEYSPLIRVNAIAPGFFLTEQNRYLLTDRQSGDLTPRGKAILSHTPAGRLGQPADLLGTLLWLVSPASAFVTGVVVPVDGGFSSFSGV